MTDPTPTTPAEVAPNHLDIIEAKLEYLTMRVEEIAGKIAEFEANIKPALAAVTNGGIFSLLTGGRKK